MRYAQGGWVEEFPAEVTVCDTTGTLLGMNACAGQLFEEDGGKSLLGTGALDCHPEPSRTKFSGLLAMPEVNVYFSTEKGEKRFFFQSPWYKDGRFAGYVEISFEVPGAISHLAKE